MTTFLPLPLAFAVGSIFLLVLVAIIIVAAVVAFTGVGESLRHKRLQTDDDRNIDAGPGPDEHDGARPTHTAVDDPTSATGPFDPKRRASRPGEADG